MKKTFIIAMLSLLFVSPAFSQTYLGHLNGNKYDPNSLSNPYGAGSEYKPDSPNNPYGKYGSPYSNKSANNPYATDAPKIYDQNGNYKGRLSTNPYDPDSTSNPYGKYGSPYSPKKNLKIAQKDANRLYKKYSKNPSKAYAENLGQENGDLQKQTSIKNQIDSDKRRKLWQDIETNAVKTVSGEVALRIFHKHENDQTAGEKALILELKGERQVQGLLFLSKYYNSEFKTEENIRKRKKLKDDIAKLDKEKDDLVDVSLAGEVAGKIYLNSKDDLDGEIEELYKLPPGKQRDETRTQLIQRYSDGGLGQKKIEEALLAKDRQLKRDETATKDSLNNPYGAGNSYNGNELDVVGQ